jgi:hypothetical protein
MEVAHLRDDSVADALWHVPFHRTLLDIASGGGWAQFFYSKWEDLIKVEKLVSTPDMASVSNRYI